MASYDWMTDPGLRAEIDGVVSDTAARAGLEQYQTGIAGTLVSLLDSNRPRRLEEELQKTASLQRTKQDALDSVRVLVKEASSYARAANRNVVTVEDFQMAYRAKFCQVWPFC